MSDAFESIAGVQQFLLARILPAVDPSLAGEVRAAAKILACASLELRTLHLWLESEWRELSVLCEEARAMLGANAPGPAEPDTWPDELPARLALRRRLDERVAQTLIDLQAAVDGGAPVAAAAGVKLRDFYELLSRHADKRLAWQSVFPTSPRTENAGDD